ncbi:uncharacterized protein LOC131432090 [Malaya genurostris]|uniref:uncharacterized protein LOC131432090 n=1 Tax=Malaya genurostris TaxID=325434 RepID=UPI0026F3A5F6|nr:uncharacterized protein LOC131432090 [Malaya genurostris]
MKFNMINSVSSESQQQQIVCNSEENGNNNQKFFVNNNTASVNRNYFLNSHQTKTTYSSGLALQKSINLYNLFANNDGRDSSKEFNAVYSAAESITVQKDFLNESVKTKSIIISNTSNINSANELKLSGNDSFSEDNLVSEDNLAEIYSCNVKSGFEISGGEKRSFENSFTPDHRARRPMNAFLIFCKRHRAIVKDKHPNLENRSITKILGDWWTTLENEQKSSYISLAKQYKDAFFTAHPDFKWYKLPAPPVRFQGKSVQAEPTLSFGLESLDDIDSARKDVHIKFEERANRNKGANYPQGVFITSDSKFIYDELNVKNSKKEDSQIGFFKLADTAHMGGLKSLMSDSYNKTIDQTADKHFTTHAPIIEDLACISHYI